MNLKLNEISIRHPSLALVYRPLSFSSTSLSIYIYTLLSLAYPPVAALGHFSVSFFFAQVDNKELEIKYSSIVVQLFGSIVNFFCSVTQKIYLYRERLKFF